MATIGEAAAHLFMDERTFRKIVDEGVIGRAARGAYDLDRVREEYVRHIREVAAGRVQTGDLDRAQEAARKDKEMADKYALENAKSRGELLPRDEVAVAMTSAFARVRARLLSLPSKLAPMILGMNSIAEIKEKITEAVNEALAELAGTVVAGIPADNGNPGDD